MQTGNANVGKEENSKLTQMVLKESHGTLVELRA